MPTTLWEQFTSAVEYVRGTTESAVRTVRGAFSEYTPAALLGVTTVGSVPSAVPSAGTDGVDVAGLATVNIHVQFTGNGGVATLNTFYYQKGTWYAGDSVEITAPADFANKALPALDTEGYERVFVQLAATTVDVQEVTVFPHNE